MLFKRIKDWATSITSFRTGDVIPVDGPNGTAKMSKDDLLEVTAQNAVDSGIAGKGSVQKSLCHEIEIEEQTPTKNAGSFINSAGQVVALSSWFITDPIVLPAGKTIVIYSRGSGRYVAEISRKNSDNSYTPLVLSSDETSESTVKWYQYTNDTDADMNVVCCGSVNFDFYCYIGKNLPDKLDEIGRIKSDLYAKEGEIKCCELEIGVTIPAYAINAGSFINNAGQVTALNSYFTTSSFVLPQGKKIKLTAAGFQHYVTMIAKVNDDDSYTPLVTSTDGTGEHNVKLYEYTNDTGADITIVCCGRVADGAYIYFVSPAISTGVDVDMSISLFSTMAVIGDSYASGCVVNDNPNFVSHYAGSWPQILGRMNGLEVTNYTKSGQWTSGFLTDTSSRGYAQMLADDAKELYIVALEINDAYFFADNIGTEADCTNDPENNPTTFYGNYAKIVWSIQNKSPKSRILCALTERTAQVYQDHNDAIRYVANKYGVPVIDCADAPFATDSIYTNKVGGHPTAIGYAAMAQGYRYLIEKAIRENVDYFKFYVGLDL